MKAIVTFHECIQNTQTYGAAVESDNHMFSDLRFSLEVGGRKLQNLTVTVSHPFGTRFEDEPFEVGPIQPEYKGPFNHGAFLDAVEQCYRTNVVGKSARGIRVNGQSTVVMENCRFTFNHVASFDVEESSEAW